MALSKNIFARLFPALNEDEQQQPVSIPAGNPAQVASRTTPFKLPEGAYAPPAGGGDIEFDERQLPTQPGSFSDGLNPILQAISGATGATDPQQERRLNLSGVSDEVIERNDLPHYYRSTGNSFMGGPPSGGDILPQDPIDQLGDISQAIRSGIPYRDQQRYENNSLMQLASDLNNPNPAGSSNQPANEMGTDSFGNPYDDGMSAPPPAPPGGYPKPVLSKRELAKQDLEEIVNRKLKDDDTSKKKRIKEVIVNILEGMAMAYKQNPRAHWSGILTGGAAGGVGGYVNKTWDEQRQQQTDLGIAKENYGIANQVAKDDNAFANDESERGTREFNALTARQKLIYDQLDNEKKAIVDAWKEVDEFDPDSPDPRVQELVAKAKKLGVVVLKKQKGERFTFQVTPAGKLIIGNTATGAYKEGSGDYARPSTLNPSTDLPDNLFGLRPDKELEDEATAATAPQFANRRVRPEVAQGLIAQKDENGATPYRNADGSLNEQQALADGVLTAEGYEGLSADKDYSQRHSATLNKLRGGQKWKQDAVTKFRTVLTNAPAGNTPVPLSEIITDFKKILEIKDAKKRSAKLDEYFREVLPNIRHK